MIRRTRPDACLSDFAFDRRLGDEFDTEEEALAREHLASCARCEGRWNTLRSERDAFTRNAPDLRVPARDGHAVRRRWLFAGLGTVAVASAMMVLLHRPENQGTRLKGGGFRVGFYVSHAGAVRAGTSGERVEPGDALRFTYGATDARYLAVLSVDGAKRVSTYYPASGAVRREEPGQEVALPLSTVLDNVLGEERVYAVGCVHPFDVEALRQGIEREPERTPAPPGCNIDSVVLHKEAPPHP